MCDAVSRFGHGRAGALGPHWPPARQGPIRATDQYDQADLVIGFRSDVLPRSTSGSCHPRSSAVGLSERRCGPAGGPSARLRPLNAVSTVRHRVVLDGDEVVPLVLAVRGGAQSKPAETSSSTGSASSHFPEPSAECVPDRMPLLGDVFADRAPAGSSGRRPARASQRSLRSVDRRASTGGGNPP